MLRDGGAAGLTTADNFTLTAGEFLEQFNVLVVDKHRTHTLAIRAQRITFLAVNLDLGTLAVDTILFKCRRFGHRINQFDLKNERRASSYDIPAQMNVLNTLPTSDRRSAMAP